MKEIKFEEELLMKIFNKEISKKQVKMFIGGVAVAVVGTTIMGIVIHNKQKDDVVEDVYYVELEEVNQNEQESLEG
jgi:hypothetical protein